MLILSAFTDEYSVEFSRQLEGAVALGIPNIELRQADGMAVAQMTHAQICGYKQQLDDRGIGVSAIGSALGKVALDADMAAHFETARKIFDFARLLGTENIRIFSFYAPANAPITACKGQVVDTLGQLLQLARAAGVTLCHENEGRIYGDTPQRCLELMQQFGGELQCVFDMGNFVLGKADPYAAYQLLKPYIRYFHIKDALAAGAVVPPGKGEAQIQKILTEHMARCDEDILITLEPHLQTFSGLNALVTAKTFTNPYQYPDLQTAFADALTKLKELMKL